MCGGIVKALNPFNSDGPLGLPAPPLHQPVTKVGDALTGAVGGVFSPGVGGKFGPKDIQARQEQLEAERQARIREGAAKIDENFSRFDDGFFDDFRTNFLGFFEPQLESQANRARGSIGASLVDRGILNSTEGIRAMTDLQDRAALERTNLANRAVDQANDLRARIENERGNLFALNEAAADPARASALASGAAASLRAPTSFDTLGNVFGDILSNVPSVLAARSNAITPVSRTFPASGSTSTRQPAGSGRVVG